MYSLNSMFILLNRNSLLYLVSGKYYIIVGLMSNGPKLGALTIMVFSVIATYYYAYIIKQLASNLYNNNTNVIWQHLLIVH